MINMQHIIAKLMDVNQLFDDIYSPAFVSNGVMISLIDILFVPGIQHDLYAYLNAAEIAYMDRVLNLLT